MQDKYSPQDVERAAHDHWTGTDAYRVTEDTSKKKFYACSMLPYPSGKLHMATCATTPSTTCSRATFA